MSVRGESNLKTRLLVLRHGQSEWNALGRWQGQADIALTPEGIEQARARHTAEIIAEKHGVNDLIIDDRLKESFIGPWEGLTYEEIESGWPGYLESFKQPPDFESNQNVVNRMTAAFVDIAAKCRGGQALIISHSGVIRTIRRELKVVDAKLDNLGGCWFDVLPDGQISAGRIISVIGQLNSSESL
ncbi:MAG: histidine phosphatase family protein [Actinobacteria bacterium]|nr:histidine phosphatase family protein [Actinomycetota bacterium]